MTDSYYLPFGPDVKLNRPFGVKPVDEWAAPAGEPIRAAGDGVVVFAGEVEDRFYADNFAKNLDYSGDVVVLKTDGPAAPFFEYLSVGKLEVKSNERVEAGQIVGLAGEENCQVAALPWRFNRSSRTAGRVNPRLYQTEYWPNEADSAHLSEDASSAQTKTEEPAAPKRRRRAADPVASEPLDSPPVDVSSVTDSAPPVAPIDANPVVEPVTPAVTPVDAGSSPEN